MSALSERIAALSPKQRELLERRVKKQQLDASAATAIQRREEQAFVPLSFAQQRLWFLDQLEPGTSLYNLPTVVRLTGNLNIAALEQSFNEIVGRHEILRTAFAMIDEQSVQVIAPKLKLTLPVFDLSSLPAAEREAEATRLAREEAQRTFNLSTGPLLRTTLLRFSDEEHILLLTMHHIISDGWSMGILVREVATLYEAFAAGKPSPLPELSIQYADYAVWQREWLQGEVLDQQINYWKSQLAGTETLQLPTDFQRPATQSYRGAYHSFRLTASLSEAIHRISRKEGATVFMTLLAVFQTLLHRYTGQGDISVGTPLAGRTRIETEQLIGFFVNTLVLRTQFSGDESFTELLRRVKEMTLSAHAHQDVPFEKLVDELQPERNLSHSPLFQTTFVLQNNPSPSANVAGLSIESLAVESTTSKFDLTLTMEEAGQVLQGFFEYSTDLFAAATIERLAAHFQNLLTSIINNPDSRLSELPLLSERERHQLLVEWNDTAQELHSETTLQRLFEEQVARTPDALAVTYEDEQLTYRELNERANQLAHHLQGLGVGAESLVGIMVERSTEMVVGLLGILKAGGAYVPLDPQYPQERLAFMLADSGAQLLLTQQSLLAALPEHNAQVVLLDADWEEIEKRSTAPASSRITPDNLAYVIYTSGSTGRPKGAMNSHRAIANRLLWMQQRYGLTGADRVLQKTPISFDVSVWEFFWPLLVGARLVMARPGGHQDSAYLAEVISGEQVTTLHFVPAMLHYFLAEPGLAQRCASVRLVMSSGEALSAELVERCYERLPAAELHNLYGPTEAAVDVTAWACPRGETGGVVPIGRPIANLQVYILDERLEPVPAGVAGELYLGGVGLARGYWRGAELTAEKFLPDPFGQPGGRLYRTGDLGRYLLAGEIEYLGRIDHQVKLRGFRIELGEIEAVLGEQETVRQCVVVAREEEGGEKRLVAYVVAANGAGEGAAVEWRRQLRERLPGYMIPSAFVVLAELPLTPNGKVDRKQLPAPALDRLQLEQSYIAPRTKVEATLATIWEDVLRVEQVGVHDNFFELGGDSIISLQVVARASRAGLRLTPKLIVEHQSISELAAVASLAAPADAYQGLVTGEVPLAPIQQRFFSLDLAEPHHFNQSVLLEVKTEIDPALMRQAVAQLLTQHDALRLRFVRDEQGRWQQHNVERELSEVFSVHDLSEVRAEELSVAIEGQAAELQRSLNLEEGPLVRVALFECGEAEAERLLVVVHHLCVDGVSWRVLLEDLQSGYEQLERGEAVELGAKTTSYQRWSEALREYAQRQSVQSELPYWLAHERRDVAQLPIDFEAGREANNTHESTHTIEVKLSVEETQLLLQTVPQAYRTQINDLLLTALAEALAQWTGNSKTLVNLEGHGREEISSEIDVSRTVGWFTSISPVLLEARAEESLEEAIKRTKEQLREIPQRGLGYGLLRYLSEMKDTAALDSMPEAEVAFNYLGQFDQIVGEQSLFRGARESSGRAVSEHGQRAHLLEIDAMVTGGALQVNWGYSRNLQRSETVESLARNYLQALRELIDHCCSAEAAGRTPSDFPLARLPQPELDRVVGRDRQIENIYPLSPMQQGMLFHTIFAPESGSYLIQLSYEVEGELEVATLQRSWQAVIDRHSILRTAFVWEDLEGPLQVVREGVRMPVEEKDWRGLSCNEQREQLAAYLAVDRQRSFDLAAAPLMRLLVIRLGDEKYFVLLSHHHVLLDGWSTARLLREVFTFYEGHDRQLEPSRPYSEYIAWLQRQDLGQAEPFWRQTLQGFTTPTALPTSLAKSLGESSYADHEIVLTQATAQALRALARRERITLNTIMQTAWALLLTRYSGEKDVVFGVTVSGRPTELPGIESMLGLFINTLPLRVQLSGEETVAQALHDVHARQVDMLQHEHSPLTEVQRWSDVGLGGTLFDSILVFENYPADAVLRQQAEERGGALKVCAAWVKEQNNYPLTVVVAPGEQLIIRMTYQQERFDEATVGRMLGHLQIVLEEIGRDSAQLLSELPLLTAEERHQLLVEWNPPTQSFNSDICLHQLFEQQAVLNPEALALSCGEEHLSYGELNERANQVAHHLQAQGVGADSLVGIMMERSLEMVVGLLGILKAGGAYVPLDPAYPQERLAFMLADSGAQFLATQQSLLAALPEHDAQMVLLDADWEEISSGSTENPVSETMPEHLAYVIYTSGSTGRPKGVLITHANVTSLLAATQPQFKFGPTDVVTMFHSYGFDFSVWELWGALCYGGRLVVVPYWVSRSPADFCELLKRERVTVLNQTPSAFQQLIQLEEEATGSKRISQDDEFSLRVVIFGGEALEVGSLRGWFERHGDERPLLVNMYGITETTVHVTYRELSAADAYGAGGSVIGRAIADLRVYVLDQQMGLVPVGVSGELYVGGEGLARGYLKRAELTAERFVPDPFSGERGGRLYRTGDVVRWSGAGELEYLGRADEQVKIRGFRIELGEIEAVLGEQETVRQCVVVAREEEGGEKRLVAYVVAANGAGEGAAIEWRQHLQERLPEYMVPAAFVVMEELPLTANGKIDRKQLPAPELDRLRLEQSYIAPRTKVEATLAAIWEDVLRVEQVGVHDNFFELGGDSILSLQIVARASRAGLRLTPRLIFEHQSISELAAVTSLAEAPAADQGLVTGSVALTPIQRRFFSFKLSEPHHFNQSVLLETKTEINPALMRQAVAQLLTQHDALRLRFVRDEQGRWQQHNVERELSEVFSVHDLSEVRAEELSVAIEGQAAELQRSLNLEEGPLVRVALFECGEAEAERLLVVVHHLCVDGVSWRVLLEDLQSGYEQLERGEAVELGAKTTSYQRWSEALREYAQSDTVQSEWAYWQNVVSVEAVRLPVDHADGHNSKAATQTQTFKLSEAKTRALLQEVPQAYRTQINDVLLTALGQTFAQWTGNRKILINLEGHGREEISSEVDVSRTVGWFTSIFPVAIEARTGESAGEAIKRTKEQLREIPQRGLGYGLLRYLSEELGDQTLLEGNEAEVSFNYLGQFDQVLNERSIFTATRQTVGRAATEQGEREHLLEINALIAGGQLQISWSSSSEIYRKETIERLAQNYREALQHLIDHCLADAGGYTPSDFPLARLDQQELDRVVGRDRQIENIYSLSPVQQGMLFHTLFAPESGVYVIQLSYEVEGELNVKALRRAWRQVIERHAILRTSYVWDGLRAPVQVVHQEVELPCVEQDWGGLPEDEQRQRLDVFLAEDRQKGVDISRAPLMRLSIIRLGAGIHVVTLTQHHLLLDGWGVAIVLKEVFAYYDGFCRGQLAEMEPSRPYGEYIEWLQRQDLGQAERFWRETLRGFTVPTPLPAGRTASGTESDEQEFKLSRTITQELKNLARREHVTLNTIVQAVWALLLSRYSGEEDVVFGVTVSGRPAELPGIESMLGLFINTLPLRVPVPGQKTVTQWLQEVHARQIELQQYEYSPLVEVQRWSDLEPGMPLFESIIVFENYPVESVLRQQAEEPGGTLKVRNVRAREQNNYPLSLTVVPEESLRVGILYQRARFDGATVGRMLGHLQTVLEAVARDPAQRLSELPLLTVAERRQLLYEWNDTKADYPLDKCLHEFFEAQVKRTPEAIAVACEQEQLTYRELNERANQLAHYLQSLGVGPDVYVGIYLERSLEMVIALLGVLKAGGAYLPLDPMYPQERLSFMLKDTAVAVLVTGSQFLKELPEHEACVVSVDGEWEQIAGCSADNPAAQTSPDNLAYVIYTSGSTGRPKGAMIPHRAIVNHMLWMQQCFPLTAADRVLQKTPFSFDASVWEFYAPLLSGAVLVMAAPGVQQDVGLLAAVLSEEGVTVLQGVPSLLRVLVEEEALKQCRGQLRRVFSGGEALTAELAEAWRERTGAEIFNLYGPTETTIDMTVWPYDRAKTFAGQILPLGRPIPNAEVYILDARGEPVPAGVAGELHVGGVQLGRGYLNRPELTAEKFIPDRFSGQAGARLYKSGDLVRYWSDGTIEFLGRIDFQVKVRGFRIELGEIEAVLGQHPAVKQTAVVAERYDEGDQRLLAYLSLVPGTPEPSITAMREFLAERLPEYMVPHGFITLEEMPLMPNGKVDRKQLPAPEQDRQQLDQAYVAPGNAVEEILAAIWEDVLGVEQVGVYDDFFELGGHSLLATRVISRVRQVFSMELPLRRLFEFPTVATLAACVESERQAERPDLLESPLLLVERNQQLPLSFAQQRLWFLDQLEPESASYNMPAAVRLTGRLDGEVLGEALNEVVRRHEVLRTRFMTVDGKPIQVISPSLSLPFPVLDISALLATERERETLRLAREEAQRPFDLSTGPLLRTSLLQLSDEEHVLLVTMHHIVSDGWSMGVLVKEVATLYEAFAAGQPSPLPELSIQYADYAVWQQSWLEGEVLEKQTEYWKRQLVEAEILELPADHARPAVQSYAGARYDFELKPKVSAGISRLSQQEGVTLFMTLLAAFQALLHRYSGQEDISVGTPIAGRTRLETESLIGFFVNTLVLRTQLHKAETFSGLLRQVRDITLEAHAHQDVPFEKLVEELQPERDLSRTPLFQVMFTLQNNTASAINIQGLSVRSVATGNTTAKFDLSLDVRETEQGLFASFEYSTDLFDAGTIERLAAHFQNLLEGIVQDPDQCLSRLPLLTPDERDLMLSEWSGETRDFPRHLCVHQLFEQQVERTPDAVAVIFEGEQLTYRELNKRANQLAHYLQSLGVTPDSLVGICVERSIEMMVGLLGIMKAGGAYLPLDPQYPPERLAFMLSDANVGVLLTQKHLSANLPEQEAEVVHLDSSWPVISSESAENPIAGLSPGHLAYVIYTSGSTGRPKGVMVTHSGLLNFLTDMRRWPGLEAQDTLLSVTTLSFDIAALELFLPLLAGARVVIAGREAAADPSALISLLEQGLTVMQATPATWRMLIEAGWEGGDGLRVLCGGEAMSAVLAAQLVARSGEVWNLYGPTETTIWSARWAVREQTPGVRIGEPIANTQCYVLDQEMGVVPIGVSGELYIGGEGLARGYLKRAELTAERFVPNPFSEVGGRLYRTGDTVRWRAEGELEYLGRADEQVKIRGFRIELGEIEAVLGEQKTVSQCVVVAREEVGGEKRLVAYVVAANGAGEGAAVEWRQHLRERMPEYMMPAAFVVLEEMPLTANGKIDRKQLPAPELDRRQMEKQYVGPRTVIEEVVAGIWQEALGVEQVGVYDNFFELGGHSLLATRIISRVRQVFSMELPLRKLFEFPTVATLAACIESEQKAEQSYILAPPLLPVERNQQLPLSFAQQRLWFLDQLEPDSDFYNLPAAVRLTGKLDLDALTDALNEVVRRHESLRTSFITIDGKPIQVISPTLSVEVPVVDLSVVPEAEREGVAQHFGQEEARRPFKLDHAPLLRATLLRLATDEHVVLLTMHHIISDGWSMNVLVKEVASIYEAYSQGRPSPLAELPVQYADFAAWQQAWLQGEVMDRQIAYWKRQLAGAETLDLPADRARPPVQSYAGARYSFELPTAVVQELYQLSHREAATLFMTLLTVFKGMLYRYTNQNDLSIGTPIAGRTRLESEPLIGFFVNTLVLRTQLTGIESFRELLRRVRDLTLEAHAHQDLPFEKLVEELQPERDLSRTPLFQIAFTLQKSTSSAIDVAGLTLRSFGSENTTAKVDLSLDMRETEEGLTGTFEYNTDLFDARTIERMSAHFQTLVTACITNPDEHISHLPMMTSDERNLMLSEWSGETRDFPRNLCVHELFEQQVERTPDAVAVIFEDQRLTYRELNDAANCLASYLRRQGVGPDVLVGIMMERSSDMVVGLLGILKAGGVYVPFDPQYPAERLAFMLEDSGVDLMLTQQSLLDALPGHNMQVVLLDSDWDAITMQSREDLQWPESAQQSSVQASSQLRPQHLAYVIYTSGSTGKPKGVMIEHRSLTNYIQAVGERFALQPGDRMLQFFSLSFDAIAEELYSCLTRGATLVLRTAEMMATPLTFLQECARRRITVLDLPVAYWHELSANLRAEDWAQFEDLRLIAIGGEEAMPERFAQWHRAVDKRVRLINTYGPTEATIIATMYELSRTDGAVAEAERRIPIGRPVENVKTYILDKQLQPVPTGVIGELYLAGVALARGYFNHPGLTGERFVPDPFSGEPGARLYKTGDLVRYLPDGNIEFRGRNDHQVKVRGFRVELGEVESAIVEHPLVHDAVVMARDEHGEKRLVAYVVPTASEQLTTGELRHFLGQGLPHYMLPSHVILLDALPLLPNGKLDRRALPAPDHSRPDLEGEYVAPRDEVEQQIAAIWEEVLGIEGVGVHDNFFDLGGHSLLATQIVSRLRSAFQAELPLRRLFETPTVEGLALAVTSGPEGRPEMPVGVIERTSRGAEELLLEKLDQLSDEEVELLLPRILAGEKVADEQQF